MKETIKINLGGLLFDLDNDAYDRLKAYLDSIKIKFDSSGTEGQEILEDIESRIAEILQQKMSDSKQVITLSDIEEIIALLGTADEMDDLEEEEKETSKSSSSSKQHSRSNKRFYRDPQNSILGGVSSGIAAYFNIDPLWIRLIFVFLFFANLAGLIIYIILWFILPPAHTTGQRLEMQGKRVTLNDIEDSVRNEYEKVRSSVKDIPNSRGYRNAESALSEVFTVLGRILVVFIKVIGAIIGVSLLIALVATIIGVVVGGAAFMPWQVFHNWHFPNIYHWTNVSLFSICLFIVLALPIIALLTKIIRMLFDIPSRNRVAAGIGATIWVIAFISLIVLLVVEGEKGLFRSTDRTSYTLNVPEDKALYVSLEEHRYDEDDFEYYQVFNFKFGYDDYHDDFFKRPKLEIASTDLDVIKLRIVRNYANFKIGRVPDNYDEIANYNWRMNDTLLVLNEYYVCDDDNAWRVPFVVLKLEIPEGQEVYFDDDLQKLLDNKSYSGQHYKMTNGSLKKVLN